MVHCAWSFELGHDITIGQKALALSKEKMRDRSVHSSECDVVASSENKSNDTNSKPSVLVAPGAFLMEYVCVA